MQRLCHSNGLSSMVWPRRAGVVSRKGVRFEWHLLNALLFKMAVFFDIFARDGARFGEQRIRLMPTFDSARFGPPRSIADLLLRDEHKPTVERFVVARLPAVPPSDPALYRVFETERAWQARGEYRRLRQHQADQIVSQQRPP